MTAHRSLLRTTPEVYARASLLHDGAVLSLPTVADALDVTVDVAARLVALGRLHASGEVLVLPPGCGPHLGGMVLGSHTSALHLRHCEVCRSLRTVMDEGMHAARARWTNGAEATTAAHAAATEGRGGAVAVPTPPPPRGRSVARVPAPPAHLAVGTIRGPSAADGPRPLRLHHHRVEGFRWAPERWTHRRRAQVAAAITLDVVPAPPPPSRVLLSA